MSFNFQLEKQKKIRTSKTGHSEHVGKLLSLAIAIWAYTVVENEMPLPKKGVKANFIGREEVF